MLAEAQCLRLQETGKEHLSTPFSLKGWLFLNQAHVTQPWGQRTSQQRPEAGQSLEPRRSLVFHITHRKLCSLHIPWKFGGVNFPPSLSSSGFQELALVMSTFKQQ